MTAGERPADPQPSVAQSTFADALAVVASNRPTGAEAADGPAFRYRVRGGGGDGDGDGDGGGDGDARPGARGHHPEATGSGPIATAARRLRAGDLSVTELVEESIIAAEKQGVALGAVVELMASDARADAARLDRMAGSGEPLGPLHGIPITVKDIINVAGVATRAGSDAYYAVPTRDATAVARLRAAGAVILAKVSTHEFALGVTTPQSANPFDHRRIPGGSSGGSAIAVACGIGLGSVGTDTRASIRVPAALCGVVGLKGTHGLVPTEGIVPLSWTMDHVAPIAATVADAALLLEVMAGRPWAAAAPPSGLVVGVAPAAFDGCEPAVAAVCTAAIERLGFGVLELDRPDGDDFDAANACGLIVSRCEAAAFHRSLGADRSRYWDEVGDQLNAADAVTATDYLDAQRLRARLAADLLAVFEDCGVVCMPTVGVQAPLREDFARFLTVLSRTCVPWSLVGFPAVSVPCGMDDDGFPVGLQVIGPPGAEARVLAVASAVERTAP